MAPHSESHRLALLEAELKAANAQTNGTKPPKMIVQMRDEKKQSFTDLAPPWITIVVSLLIGCCAATVFAYNNFVTVRERDASRDVFMSRVISLESGQKEEIKELGELKGKLDSLILMEQQSHSSGK